MRPPEYFERIRRAASQRWDQLEADADLAAPWKQLFKQVQQPRHVLSELMQNADDAKATRAWVTLVDDSLVFSHNGEDFSEAQFHSLCRFAFSNKRTIHTIGFRGIGFKSTFSLGSVVELRTATLSVCFKESRFTEPEWMDTLDSPPEHTEIRIRLKNQQTKDELRKYIREWQSEPVALLFFRNLHELELDGGYLIWQSIGNGPIPNSVWKQLKGDDSKKYLYVRSASEAFPPLAVKELIEERSISQEDAESFPPVHVDLVLGAEGRVHVVLPTHIKTSLPFAFNAPFLPDPARDKILDPNFSHLNRWLLERVGRLAAESMLAWVTDETLTLDKRVYGYDFLPNKPVESSSALEDVIEREVTKQFVTLTSTEPVWLGNDERVHNVTDLMIVPREVYSIWTWKQMSFLWQPRQYVPIHSKISDSIRYRLIQWGWVQPLEPKNVISRLDSSIVPKPDTWEALFNLWAFYASSGHRHVAVRDKVRLLPVLGLNQLQDTLTVIRIRKDAMIEESEFSRNIIQTHCHILDERWIQYLEYTRQTRPEDTSTVIVSKLADEFRIDSVTQLQTLHARIWQTVTQFGSLTNETAIGLAQLAAEWDVQVPDTFRYVTGKGQFSSVEKGIYNSDSEEAKRLVPPELWLSSSLHSDYFLESLICAKARWIDWAASPKSRLRQCPLPNEQKIEFHSKVALIKHLERFDIREIPSPELINPTYRIDDWDFPDEYWTFWEAKERSDEPLWMDIALGLLKYPEYNSESLFALAKEVPRIKGNTRTVKLNQRISSGWVRKLGMKACLPDTRDIPHIPAMLLMLNKYTDGFRDLFPFVSVDLDNEFNRPVLQALGVSDQPKDPQTLLNVLRTFRDQEKIDVSDILPFFFRVDSMLSRIQTTEFISEVRHAFQSEMLIYTADKRWLSASGVCLEDSDNIGMPVVYPDLRHLSLWKKVGVSDRASTEKIVEWFRTLREGELSKDQVRQWKRLIRPVAVMVIEQLGYWLTMDEQWIPQDRIKYASVDSEDSKWNLYPAIKEQTADLSMLTSDQRDDERWSRWLFLRDSLSTDLESSAKGIPVRKEWITEMSVQLKKVRYSNDEDTHAVRNLGQALETTVWTRVDQIRVVPKLNQAPVGPVRSLPVLWQEDALLVTPISKPALSKVVPEELSKKLAKKEILDAFTYAFERSANDVREYMEDQFELDSSIVTPGMPPIMPTPGETIGPVPITGEDPDPVAIEPDPTSPGPQGPSTRNPYLSERYFTRKGYESISRVIARHPSGDLARRHATVSEFWCIEYATQPSSWIYFVDAVWSQNPIVIPHEVYGMMVEMPDQVGLVVLDEQGEPIEYIGRLIIDYIGRSKIEVHPATYRASLNSGPD